MSSGPKMGPWRLMSEDVSNRSFGHVIIAGLTTGGKTSRLSAVAEQFRSRISGCGTPMEFRLTDSKREMS